MDEIINTKNYYSNWVTNYIQLRIDILSLIPEIIHSFLVGNMGVSKNNATPKSSICS